MYIQTAVSEKPKKPEHEALRVNENEPEKEHESDHSPIETLEDLPDDDMAYVSGNFAEDLGIDFFGFKELGIEVGQVPEHLFDPTAKSNQPKLKRKQTAFSETNTPDRLMTSQRSKVPARIETAPVISHFTPPLPFPPITDPAIYIGLMQPFLHQKLSAAENNKPIEDEFLVSKPKLSESKRNHHSGTIAAHQRDFREIPDNVQLKTGIRRPRGRGGIKRSRKQKAFS
jgi:hypothetical protein